MTKTQNYNLNKPETADLMRLADFNENSEILDAALAAAYSPDNLPWEMGTIDISYAEDGEVIKTFDFAPSAIFLFAVATVGGSATTGNFAKVTQISDTSSYCYFGLSENTLTLSKITGNVVSELQYVALR